MPSYYLVIVAADNNSIALSALNAASAMLRALIAVNSETPTSLHVNHGIRSIAPPCLAGNKFSLFTDVSTLEREFLTQRFTGQCFKLRRRSEYRLVRSATTQDYWF